MSNQPQTINEVLANFEDASYTEGGYKLVSDKPFDEAKAALSAMVAEIINTPDQYGFVNTSPELRELQRQRAIAKGFDMSERRG